LSLSKQHLAPNQLPVSFDPEQLAHSLEDQFPILTFALLMGSAAHGTVAPGSDLDLALYLSTKPEFSFYSIFPDAVNTIVPNVRVDFGILNQAEPVYRFEALKGHLLFTRDPEIYHTFFSRTCREYEMQMADYERQLTYRLEAASAR
jgi:hypothetical protein